MKPFFVIALLVVLITPCISQSVGVGTEFPDPSAKLDITSTTQGVLVPRLTTEQRLQISNPATGLLVFDSNTASFWFKNSDDWVELLDNTDKELHRATPEMLYMGMTDRVGVGIYNPANKLDIMTSSGRFGSHGEGRPLYVTGNMEEGDNGIEFRHYNGTQGIGFGFNTMYAAGSNMDQDLGLSAKGTLGNLLFKTNGIERMRITGSGNVGIANTSPNAPLQFHNFIQNRKVVLYEAANNDHQFFGFGTGPGVLRYQVNNFTDSHIFYVATSSNTSSELLRIRGDGNVGIGNNNPLYKLSVAYNFGIDANGSIHIKSTPRQIYFYEDLLPSKMILSHSPTFPTWGLQYTAANQFRFLRDSVEVMSVNLGNNQVKVSNRLGIGATPNAPLQFSNEVQNRKVVLYETANNDHQYLGFGINSSALRYQTVGDHVFHHGVDATTSNEVMRIRSTGNVDIPGALEIGYTIVTSGIVDVGGVSANEAVCNCPAGTVVIAGGHDSSSNGIDIEDSFPNTGSSWKVTVFNSNLTVRQFQAWAICARLAN